MSVEQRMRDAVKLFRGRTLMDVSCQYAYLQAVVDGVPDEAGRLPLNPDTGPGDEPGMMEIRLHEYINPDDTSDRRLHPVPFFIISEVEAKEVFHNAPEMDLALFQAYKRHKPNQNLSN